MKNLFEKIKKIPSFFKKNKNNYDRAGIKPWRDWGVILFVTSLVVLALALYSVYLYFKIDSNSFVELDPSKKESEIKLNTDLLNKIAQDLNDRAEKTNKINSGTVPPDPSN